MSASHTTATIALLDAVGRVRSDPITRHLFLNRDDGLMFIGLDGTVVDANDTAVAASGITRDALVGLPLWEVPAFQPASASASEREAEVLARLSRAIEATGPVQFEDELDRTLLGAMPAQWSAIRDDAGEAIGALIEAIDRRGERRAEQRFQQLTESLPHMTWSSIGGVNDYFAPVWEQFSGLPVEALLGHGWHQLMHPDDLARMLGESTDQPDEAPGAMVFRMRRHDGEYRWMEATIKESIEPDGVTVRHFGATLDITARREAEQRNLDRQRQLVATLDAAGLGGFVYDFRAQQLTGDRRFEEIIGQGALDRFLALDAEGRTDLIHPEDRDMLRERLDRVMRQETSIFDASYRLKRSGPAGAEERWISVSGRVEADETGPTRMIGVVADVTDERQEQDAHLRTQKLEVVGTLVSGVAHDFNNVIGAILSYTRVAQAELAAGESPGQSLAEIAQGALRAGDAVKRLLAFGREAEPRREHFDLTAVVEEARSLLRPSLPPEVEVVVSADPRLPGMLGNPTELHQVIVNLLTNASHAIGDERGRIEVTLDVVDAAASHHSAAGAQPIEGTLLRLRVLDTGPGMTDAVARQIFDPFFTTKPAGEGTGLGLAAVHRIVRNHGGMVNVDRPPAGGALFTLLFPADAAGESAQGDSVADRPSLATVTRPAAAADEALDARSDAATRRHGTGGGLARPVAGPLGAPSLARVLFVDDEEPLVRLAYRAMPYRGCTVTGFTDPVHALAEFEADPEAFDALVTDLSMPGLTGLELSERCREARPDLVIVMTSGNIAPGDYAEAWRRGVDAIVPKPCSIDDLVAQVMTLLARRNSERRDVLR